MPQSNYRLFRRSPAVLVLAAMMLFAGCQSATKTVATQSMLPTSEGSVFDRELSIARLSERHGEVPKATKIYQSVLQQDPRNQEALHRMGVIAAQDGRFKEALNYIQPAIAQGNASSELLGDLGYIQYKQGQFGAAEDTFNRSLDRDPRNKRSINNLGLCLVAQHKYDRALPLFRQIGTPAEAYANLAYAQSQQGDIDSAERNYHLALEADPQTKVAAVALLEIGKHRRLKRARSAKVDRIVARARPRGPRIPSESPAMAYDRAPIPRRSPAPAEPQPGFYPSKALVSTNQESAADRARQFNEIAAASKSLPPDPLSNPNESVAERNPIVPNRPVARLDAADAIASVNEPKDPFIDSVETYTVPVDSYTSPVASIAATEHTAPNVSHASFEPEPSQSAVVHHATSVEDIPGNAPMPSADSDLFATPPPAPAPLAVETVIASEPNKQGASWPDPFGVALEPVEQPAP